MTTGKITLKLLVNRVNSLPCITVNEEGKFIAGLNWHGAGQDGYDH